MLGCGERQYSREVRNRQRGGSDFGPGSAVGGGFDDQGAVTGIDDRPDQDGRAARAEFLLMETEHPGRFNTPAEWLTAGPVAG